jgi:hypothetical protein
MGRSSLNIEVAPARRDVLLMALGIKLIASHSVAAQSKA